MAKRSAVTVPSGFMQSKQGKTIELMATSHNQLLEHGSYLTAETLEVFGTLLGPKNGPSTVSPLHAERYLQNVSLDVPYENRVVPLFGQIVTYNMNGTGNSFITLAICPTWNTPERNFTVNRKEFNHVAFTPIGEHGIPDEQTHFTYSWTNSVDRCALNDTIDRDLALDPNFGVQAWLDSLAQFSVNATLTIELGIIYAGLHRGYTNIIEERNRRGVFNHHKLNERETNEAGIFAIDATRGFAAIRNYENKIPELDSVIGPAGFSQYIRDLEGETKTVPAQRLWTNPETQKLMIDFYNDGVSTVKTITLGSRKINFYELNPIAINTRNPVRYQPLIRKITIGEFYPPYADETAFDNNTSLDPSRQDIQLIYMNKTMCEERRITLQQRIRNALYYAKDGRVADYVYGFVNYRNIQHGPDNCPHTWNIANNNKDINYNIKNDQADYDTPNVRDVMGKQTIAEMPFRELPWGIGFNPAKMNGKPYYVPKDIGAFMPSQISGEWVHAAAKKMALSSEKKLDVSDIDEMFTNIKSFIEILRDAEWDDAFVEGILDKNLPKILVQTGSWTIKAQLTDRRKLLKYPGSNQVEEFRTNSDGVLDLPDRGGALRSTIPPGYANAVGLMALAREADRPESLWAEIGKQAKFILRVFTELYNMTNDTVGKTKSIDPAYSYPWSISKGLATFIDSWIDTVFGPSAPLFLGVPDSGNAFNTTTEVQRNKKKEDEKKGVGKASRVVLDTDFNGVLDKKTLDAQIYLIGMKERALASVNSAVGVKLAPLLYAEKEKKFVPTLCKLIIEFGGYTASGAASTNRISLVSGLAANVIRKLAADPPATDDEIQAYLDGFTGSKTTINKLLNEAVNQNPDAIVDVTTERMDTLRTYEKKTKVNGELTNELPADKDDEVLKRKKLGEVFVGNYTEPPMRYLRTPLTDTPKLREYLRNKSFSYVLPGDADYYYELPIEIDRLNEDDGNVEAMDFDEKDYEKELLKSNFFEFTANRTLQSFTNLNNNNGSGAAGQYQQQQENPTNLDKRTWYGKKKKDKKKKNGWDDSDEDEDIFASLKSKTNVGGLSSPSPKQSSFISDLLSGGTSNLGRDFSSPSDFTRKSQQRNTASSSPDSSSSSSSSNNLEDLTDDLFEGGWEYHREYLKREVTSAAHRFFYRLIIEAPNELDIHLKLASINAHIVNVMIVRPFIQAYVHALLLCKAGPQTWIYAFGHSTVQVTKELRGLFHIGCGFEHGMIETNPDNVAVMPAPLFHSFIGGKKVDFITDPADWNLPNPTKRSMMAFLIPNGEKTFSSPMHLRNMETYGGPDGDNAIWERKCSAFGDYYDYVFRLHNPKKADIVESNRITFNSVNTIAHVLNLGCVAYTDPNTGRKIDRPGVGPLGERRANMPGCQLAWNGQSFRFPDYSQYLLTTQAF